MLLVEVPKYALVNWRNLALMGPWQGREPEGSAGRHEITRSYV